MAFKTGGRKCTFESLENRRMLAGDVIGRVHAGTLTLKGDNLSNAITITAGADPHADHQRARRWWESRSRPEIAAAHPAAGRCPAARTRIAPARCSRSPTGRCRRSCSARPANEALASAIAPGPPLAAAGPARRPRGPGWAAAVCVLARPQSAPAAPQSRVEMRPARPPGTAAAPRPCRRNRAAPSRQAAARPEPQRRASRWSSIGYPRSLDAMVTGSA